MNEDMLVRQARAVIPSLAPKDTATGLCGGGSIPLIDSKTPFVKADIVFDVSQTRSREDAQQAAALVRQRVEVYSTPPLTAR
jgi:hypothetical protein